MRLFYIFTNSPGEVFAWVKPLVARLNTEFPKSNIFVFLTPCQYSTGQEHDVCSSFNNVVFVYRPMDTIKTIINPKFEKGIVFYMGGDPFYPKRFAKKTGSLLIGYSENKLSTKGFDLLIFKSKYLDLMVSGLKPMSLDLRAKAVLLPGSRSEHLDVALPMMLKIADNSIAFDVMLSPFTTPNLLESLNLKYPNINFRILKNSNDLASYKFAITIPGTNTMQLAFLNIPFLMIFPTHESKILRLNGFLGLLLYIPLFGLILKRIILSLAIKWTRFYALPNKQLNKEVCPELVGKFSLETAKKLWSQFVLDRTGYDSCIKELAYFNETKDPLDDVIRFIKMS